MGKITAESTNRLNIFWLKKHGYLKMDSSCRSGVICWTNSYSGHKSRVGFAVVNEKEPYKNEETYIELFYSYTPQSTGIREELKYRIELTATPCNYGGVRYWFMCPAALCSRRVGVLFGIGKYFGCRRCANIAYTSQMQGGRWKGFVSIPDIDKAEAQVKRKFYRGKPTRKYRKALKLNARFELGFATEAIKLLKLRTF